MGSEYCNDFLPQWLVTKENYIPASDKDAFINKSILSLLGIIAGIRAQDNAALSKYHVNPKLKVLLTLILAILLSLSKSFIFVVIVITYLLLLLSLMNGREIISILKISLPMTFFSILIMVPAALSGNIYSLIMIPTKIFAGITAVNIMSRSERWDHITGALKNIFIPDFFIFILDITVKYIIMLGEFSVEMLSALKLRSVGKNQDKYSALSGITGTLFIKSVEMSEEMHSAMMCRCFTGQYHINRKVPISPFDIAFIAINLGIMLCYFYFARR